MQIDEQQHGAVTILSPRGALAGGDALDFRQRLMGALSLTAGRLVLDLSLVPYVDSAGLEALLDGSDEMARAGQVLRLCAANRTVREVLELTDLDPLLDQFDDVTVAVRSFL